MAFDLLDDDALPRFQLLLPAALLAAGKFDIPQPLLRQRLD